MGKVASSVDNALIVSSWSAMQRELLDRRDRDTRAELAAAIVQWIEGWFNSTRRRSSLGMRSPHDYEVLHTAAPGATLSTGPASR